MKLLMLTLALVVAAMPSRARVEAKPILVSRYTELSQCKAVERPPAGEDWVYFRCKGLGAIPIWYVCSDSVRCRYGFGTKPNVSSHFFGSSRDESWPIEWRGSLRRGRFAPIAVVVRLPSADPDQGKRSSLIVYRLRADGTSCIVGEASSNEGARKIADGSAGDFRCLGDLDLL